MVFIIRLVWLPVALVIASGGEFPPYQGMSILFFLGIIGFGLWGGDIKKTFF